MKVVLGGGPGYVVRGFLRHPVCVFGPFLDEAVEEGKHSWWDLSWLACELGKFVDDDLVLRVVYC